jgi:hypothetical protein
VPIHLDDSTSRVNVIHVAWFEPTPDPAAIELELQSTFDETPLEIIPVRIEQPVPVAGALYVTPQRTPGFAGEAVVTATVRRMVISHRIQELLPEWAPWLRGVLELAGCAPTASREDLVRDTSFYLVREILDRVVLEHLEGLAATDLPRLHALLSWHRYSFAGAALAEPRLRALLRRTYPLATTQGTMSFDEVLEASDADPLIESDAEKVVWYNPERRQERYTSELFEGHAAPCVQALRTFEESLLAAWVTDLREAGAAADLRIANPGSPGFAASILGAHEIEDAPSEWQEYLGTSGAMIQIGDLREQIPVLAFLDERSELARSFDEIRDGGIVPESFQRVIDKHLGEAADRRNRVLLNRRHRLVGRVLSQRPGTPLASVLRLLVVQALASAGARLPEESSRQQVDDLDWIAEALWGRSE